MKTLNVIAPPGKICPMAGGRRVGMITDKKAVTVPNNSYYRRRLKDGSLLDAASIKDDAAAGPAQGKPEAGDGKASKPVTGKKGSDKS